MLITLSANELKQQKQMSIKCERFQLIKKKNSFIKHCLY